jgi:hypothetical protein
VRLLRVCLSVCAPRAGTHSVPALITRRCSFLILTSAGTRSKRAALRPCAPHPGREAVAVHLFSRLAACAWPRRAASRPSKEAAADRPRRHAWAGAAGASVTTQSLIHSHSCLCAFQ